MSTYAYEFDPDEPNNTAATVFRLAARAGPRVLDVGSGPGIVASALVRLAAKDVTCLDIDAAALAEAEQAGVTATVVADLEQPEWYQAVAGREYDVVILADILEHLHDGGAALRALREQEIVAPDAVVVVSFPNVAHESIVAQLLAGTFRYTGLLDQTHLRFFTLTSMRDLLEASGFVVEEVHRTVRPVEESGVADVLLGLPEAARAAIKNAREGRTYQYVVQARPSELAGQLVIVRGELTRLRAECWEYEQARERLATTMVTLEEERAYFDEVHAKLLEQEDLVTRLEAENRALQAAEEDLKERLGESQRKIAQIRSSRAYRVALRMRRVAGPVTRAARGWLGRA